jgi:pSer/pThr/pTyr-binding forkhead associated (FHA) protein
MTGTTALLIGRTGAVAGKDYPVADTMRIGAARDAEIRIRAEGISRIHARLWQEGTDYWIEDAGSTNGTFLSGIRIRKDRLRHLDVVTLGRSIDLIFVIREDETAPAARPRTRGLISAALEPVDGPDAGTPIEIPQGEITLGRADSNNIVVENRAISKVHARMERTPDVVTIQDLQSVNGTFVNDTRIESPLVLGRGDRICLAGVRTFTVTLERDGTAKSATSSASQSGPLFSQEWKTRLVWSAEELAELAELAQPTPATPPEPEKPAKKRIARPAAPAKPAPSAPAAPVAKASPAPPPASPVGKAAPPPRPLPVIEPQPPPPPLVPVPKKPAGDEPTVFASAPPVTPRQVRLSGATPHTLEPGTTTIGRAVTAALRIDDRKASRAHAEIVVADDEVAIEDKGSVNGTFVNGRAVVARQPLVSGDRIKIGDTEWTVEIS